jgi:hypothetical protein
LQDAVSLNSTWTCLKYASSRKSCMQQRLDLRLQHSSTAGQDALLLPQLLDTSGSTPSFLVKAVPTALLLQVSMLHPLSC